MNISDILWVYFILMTIQPLIAQMWLEAARVRLLGKLERARASRVIALVHRQETMSLLGYPILRYINTELPDNVYRFMELFPQPKQRVPSVQYIPVPVRQRGSQQNQ